jgi:hypothetical protein
MSAIRRIGIVGGLILVGVVVGLSIGHPHEPTVDLGAAPTQYVPAGTLKIVDSGGVELATLLQQDGNDIVIQFYNGPDGYLGQYVGTPEWITGSSLFVYGPPKEDRTPSSGVIRLYDGPSGHYQVESTRPDTSGQVNVPVKPAYQPPRFSQEWWAELLFSRESPATLQSKLPSEDTRLVQRDGRPFAVCGHDLYGNAEIVLVSSDYKQQAGMYFENIQGSVATLTFEMFDAKGEQFAVLETADSPRGPRLSVASEDRVSNTGYSLFPLDPTGIKLSPNSVPPWQNDGIVDWLARPMYRARLPIQLVDPTGKVIWSSGKTGAQ